MILTNILFTFMVRCVVAIVLSMFLTVCAVALIQVTSGLWSVFDNIERCAVLTMALILVCISYRNIFTK